MHPDSLDLAREVIQERLRWAREQGHPFYLWPDVPVGEWRSAPVPTSRIVGFLRRSVTDYTAQRPTLLVTARTAQGGR